MKNTFTCFRSPSWSWRWTRTGRRSWTEGPRGGPRLWARTRVSLVPVFLDLHYPGIRHRILPFSHKGVERTEIMLVKYDLNTKLEKKILKTIFESVQLLKKKSDQDPLVGDADHKNVTDPQHCLILPVELYGILRNLLCLAILSAVLSLWVLNIYCLVHCSGSVSFCDSRICTFTLKCRSGAFHQ